jgi:flagellar protein FlaI
MATGHYSYSTAHANDIHDLIQRLENPPISLPRSLFTSLDAVVFLNSVTVNGKPVRRVTRVIEIIKLDPSNNRLVSVTPFSWSSEVDDRFEKRANSKILQKIKKKKGWDDKRLYQELENRKKIIEWLIKENLRSYKDVGHIVSIYARKPNEVLEKLGESSK